MLGVFVRPNVQFNIMSSSAIPILQNSELN